jgi:hypothetical protein
LALIDDILPIAYSARAIAGQLGFRPHTVALVNTAWSGDHIGDGIPASETQALTESGGQPPKVRWLNDEERALANAGIGEGVVEVGPITPIGDSLAALTESMVNGQTRMLLITGAKHPNGALYRITDVDQQKALRIMIRGVAVGHSTP